MSPIFLLPSDILLHIFDINASYEFWSPLSHLEGSRMVVDEPLSLTIQTSHTCKAWRQLLLDSPSIWGKLIDLDVLDSHLDLQNEVMLRTRNAPLWIKGSDMVPYQGAPDQRPNTLLVPLVQKNWRRIHSLRLSLDKWGSLDELWAAISQDAPYLRRIEISSPLVWQETMDPASFNFLTRQQELFAGSSPLLNSFSCAHFPVNPLAPWIPQLVHFDSRAVRYPLPTPYELFSALCRMTILEELQLTLRESTPQLEQFLEAQRTIAFYNLRDVALNARLSVCRWFLASLMAPERLQIFKLFVRHATFEDGQAVLNQFTNVITRSLTVSNLRLRAVHLRFNNGLIYIHASSDPDNSGQAVPNEVSFSFKTGPPSGLELPDFPCFTLPPVSFVTHLTLNISPLLSERRPQGLADLLKNFTSVTTILASGHTISILLEHGAGHFPALEVIKQMYGEDITEDAIREFGLRRNAYGYNAVQIVHRPSKKTHIAAQ